ncbi:FAD assembly factor SdhE [Aquirhabdus parva]|uniref:FAD assembly factor SdhE n=1 Tax=Aquirhabdus parva TaxID=2283318 RepID=A0A345PA87_9GAMM|nr:succinate dehydrogenase assembly factor 2 [Aquirhabdus parva]AXI04196.1 succinate dehydrogenase assembly factor 2 [Aquirhabdus parva]
MSNQAISNPETPAEINLADRKVIYRARRGLKELDYYFDPYVREHFLQADSTEKAAFSELIDQEDPDLLDWFMNVTEPPASLTAIIARLKSLRA